MSASQDYVSITQKLCLVCQEQFPAEAVTCPKDGIQLVVLVDENIAVGKVFCERYEILEVLGGGGMGLVYKARHLLMQRTVAIKVLHNRLVGDGNALKRFKVESQAASVLTHPNVLTVFDFGISPAGQAYMVMDYLNGCGLDELLEEDGRLDASRALPIFTQVAAGLAHAHGKGIIHRDIKPSNIMLVDNEGRKDFVKIVDFGIAKMLNPPTEELKNLTQTGEIYGSPLYMSPEQFRGLKLDPRTDIYSFGAVMYRTLTGQQMFDHNDQLQLMYKQVTELPPKFAEAAPGVKISAELESIVFKCLAKERDARFQSMHELASALEQITLETEKPANTVRLQSAGQDVLPSSSGDQSADAQQCAVPAISHGNAPVAPAGQLREQAIGAIPFVEVEEDTGNTTQGSGETTKTVVCEPLPVDKKYELKPEGKKEDTISIVLPRQAIWSTLVAVAVIIGSLCVLYFIMSPAPTTQQANSPLKKDVPPSAAGQREKGAVVKQEKFPAIETKGQKPKVADLGAMSGPVVTAGSKKHTQAVKKPRRPSRAPQAVTSTNWQTRYYTSRPATPYVTPAAAPSYSSTYTSTRQIPPDNEPTMPSPAVASPYHSNSPAEPASSSYYSSRLGERLPNGRVNFGQLKKQFRGKVGRLKNSIGRIIDRL